LADVPIPGYPLDGLIYVGRIGRRGKGATCSSISGTGRIAPPGQNGLATVHVRRASCYWAVVPSSSKKPDGFRHLPVLMGCVVAIFAAGCSSRSVPGAAPVDSPASMDAPSGVVPSVNRSLRSDPPLPGEPIDGWPGLATPAPAAKQGSSTGVPTIYACSMHPTQTSTGPGSCPVCGMALVRRP
jgi:hypothetical protein